MRWFVEVSRVGDTSADEKYCVEAKQWQAALQEARKLRGDSGPLSKFSIELLDDGYRAVDPKQKLRFVVAKAPQDAELTTDGPSAHRNGQAAPALVPSAAPPAVTPVSAPSIAAPSVSAPSISGPSESAPSITASPVAGPVLAAPVATRSLSVEPPPPAVTPHAEPYAGVPSSNLSPRASVSAAHVVTAASAAPAPSAFPPRPVTSAPRAASVKAPSGISIPSDVIPPAPALPQNLGPTVANQNLTQPSAAIDMPPPSTVLRKRQEEPTAESPITYREVAYVVAPGVTRGSVEALLWTAFRDISRELAGRAPQKFVQLAVFDHEFDKRPERAPLGTLAWKDWRGNPVLTFPLFDGTQPARASVPVPAPSIKPLPVVRISSTAPPPAAPAPASVAAAEPVVIPTAVAPSAPPAPVVIAPVAAALAPVVIAPVVATEPAPAVAPVVVAPVAVASPVVGPSQAAVAAEPAVAVAAPPVVAAEPAVAVVAPPVIAAEPAVAVVAPPVIAAEPAVAVVAPPVVAAEPAVAVAAPPVVAPSPAVAVPEPSVPLPLTREKAPSSHPSAGRASRPRLPAVQRRAGEDLIGELFETMHDLHFMQGVADGAEFVLAALDSVLPCDGVLIHVFDIDRREFVVTRAKGPGAIRVLLHRTPDSEPFFTSVMRRPGSVVVDAAQEPRVLGPRWDALGVQPQRVLCGPVRQGGRYLGLLEVVNPLGDAPFHQTEQNAVDYICQQLAQFLVNRPIVLEADVILRR